MQTPTFACANGYIAIATYLEIHKPNAADWVHDQISAQVAKLAEQRGVHIGSVKDRVNGQEIAVYPISLLDETFNRSTLLH